MQTVTTESHKKNQKTLKKKKKKKKKNGTTCQSFLLINFTLILFFIWISFQITIDALSGIQCIDSLRPQNIIHIIMSEWRTISRDIRHR
jgi:ABC-type phosphate transport system permease subunit